MYPFRLKIELKSPIIPGDRPTNLDALLAAAIDRRFNDWDRTEEELKRLLKMTGSVYHASAMKFGVTIKESLINKKLTLIKSMKDEKDLGPPHYWPDGKETGQYKSVLIEGGFSKISLHHFKALKSPFVIFYGYGDPERISQYLEFCLIGLGMHGNRHGAGNIGNIHYEVIDSDFSLLDKNKKPNRPLPLDLFQSLGGCPSVEAVEGVRVAFPYYSSESECLGVRPERTTIERL